MSIPSLQDLASLAMSLVPHDALMVGVGLLLGEAVRRLPVIAAKLFGKAEDALLAVGSPAMDELVLGAVRAAEKALPDPKSGEAKYAMAAAAIVGAVPSLRLSQGQVQQMIEDAVVAMRAEADKRQADHDAGQKPQE